jgi:hypothetical protein
MKGYPEKPTGGEEGWGAGEETLRLLAGLPAPQGLEERVHGALRAAPRESRVLAWPVPLRAGREWMRAAAAAAIAFVIAGGGWSVYSRVQPHLPLGGLPPAVHTPVAGGFAGAGLVTTPKTVVGPVLTHPAPAAHAPAVKKKNATQGTPAAAGSRKDPTQTQKP